MQGGEPQNTKWTGLEKKLLVTITVKTLKTQNKGRLLKTIRGRPRSHVKAGL